MLASCVPCRRGACSGLLRWGLTFFLVSVLESVFLCYDTTGSSGDKSLGGAVAILRDDTKL